MLVMCAAVLCACGGGGASVASAPAAAPTATNQQVAGSPIAHVIVVVQENRTFDNMFGSSSLAGGAGYPGADTTLQALLPDGSYEAMQAIPLEIPYTPLHAHQYLVAEYDNRKMDGFAADPAEVTQPGYTPPVHASFGFVPSFENLLYHALAYRYAVADRMFASRLVPSFAAHQWLVAGQGPADNPIFAAPPPGSPPYNQNLWGCIGVGISTAAIFTTGENTVQAPPCYDYQTLADLLDANNITWRYYTGIEGTFDGSISSYAAVRHIRNGPDWARNVITPQTQILSDITNCALPSVSYVTPPETSSDLSGTLGAGGPAWAAGIYLAIVNSQLATNTACQYYPNTAIILTWDDSGGWYDHVVPPKDAQGNSWGFRVPLVVVSAWAKSNYAAGTQYAPYVSHTPREFGSILRYIEKNFGLGSLGTRDAIADDLSDMFDYARSSPVPAIPSSSINSTRSEKHVLAASLGR